MAIDERARHQLFQKLEKVLGSDDAAVLMEHLPPTGWGDVARRQDVESVRAATKRDLDALETKIELKLERTVNRLTWRFLTFHLVGFLGLAGLILGRT